MNRASMLTAAVLSVFVGGAVPAMALQTKPAAPASAPVPGPQGSLTATVDQITGTVLVQLPGETDWKKAEVGMQLPEGATIRTGLRSACRCSIPPDQTFAVDRVTTVRIAEAVRDGGKVRTDLSMKYGRTQYEIQAAGLEHESTISSPGSTLAVRGTDVELTNMAPFPPRAVSFTGTARFINGKRATAFGGKGAGTIALNSTNRDAADAALVAAVIDPQYKGSRTATEKTVIADQLSRGAVLGFDEIANIPVITGGSPIRTEAELVPTLPGRLDFVARWQTNADINLSVFLVKTPHPENVGVAGPGGISTNPSEFVYPGFGLNHSPSGGTTAFDDRGGPRGGTEIVYWPGSFPQGLYFAALTLVSGPPTDVTLNVFVDGKKKNFRGDILPQFDSDGNIIIDPVTGLPKVTLDYPSTDTVHLPAQIFDPTTGKLVNSHTGGAAFLNPDAAFLANVTAAGTPITDSSGGGPADLPPPPTSAAKARPATKVPSSALKPAKPHHAHPQRLAVTASPRR